jgi:transcriptional regulator of acetoin/glycerol metabolism
MNEECEKIRCQSCELVQWSDRARCRRCGSALSEPVVKLVERVVEKVVIRPDPQCLNNLVRAPQLLAEASDRLTQPTMDSGLPPISWPNAKAERFPTIAQVEGAMILAAYQGSNRRPFEAPRLLGMGKTTFYRKLKEIGKRTA